MLGIYDKFSEQKCRRQSSKHSAALKKLKLDFSRFSEPQTEIENAHARARTAHGQRMDRRRSINR